MPSNGVRLSGATNSVFISSAQTECLSIIFIAFFVAQLERISIASYVFSGRHIRCQFLLWGNLFHEGSPLVQLLASSTYLIDALFVAGIASNWRCFLYVIQINFQGC